MNFFKPLCIMLLLFMTVTVIFAQEKKPDEVKVGVYLIDVYNLNFKDKDVTVDFYLWFSYKNPELDPLKTFEIVNAKKVEKMGETFKKSGDTCYQVVKCRAIIKKSWDIINYPFDQHKIQICIEDTAMDASGLVFVPDEKNSNIDKNFKMSGWKIQNFKVNAENHLWETTYGDPDIKTGDYSYFSRFFVTFDIVRSDGAARRFFKTFIALLLTMLISFIALFIAAGDIAPRFNLLVGSLFATLANQYVIGSKLPETSSQTLVDLLYNMSFFYIFIGILKSTITSRLFQKGKKELAEKIDHIARYIIIPSYIVAVILLIIYYGLFYEIS